MRWLAGIALSTFALGFIAEPAFGQRSDSPPQSSAPAPNCELHIWVQKEFFARGHLPQLFPLDVTGRVKKYDDLTTLLKDYLGPKTQYDIVKSVDVAKALGLSNYRVIYEDALDAGTDIRMKRRRIASGAPCYAEFRTLTELYEKTSISRMLYSGFLFRQFEGDRLVINFLSQRAANMRAFPPKSSAEEEVARDDVRFAFRQNLERYLAGTLAKLKH